MVPPENPNPGGLTLWAKLLSVTVVDAILKAGSGEVNLIDVL